MATSAQKVRDVMACRRPRSTGSGIVLSMSRRFVVLASLVVVVGACGSSSSGSSQPAAASGGAGGVEILGGGGTSVLGGGGGAPGGASAQAGTGGGLDLGPGTGGGGPTLIYAHTDTTLYQLDPTSPSLAITKIGDFDCVPGNTTAMTDVAVNANGDLWGVSAHAVWPLEIQNTTVHCGSEIHLSDPNVRFYALTFAPAGVLAPGKEVLVAGNTAGELWSIDANGGLTQRGVFGTVPADDGNGHPFDHPGTTWELAGDIVFLANGGDPVGFATVRDCPSPPDTTGCSFVNTLIEIDVPKLATATTDSVTKAIRGKIMTRTGCGDGLGGDYGNMYGIAAWNDKVYGFSRKGNLVDIQTSDGGGCLVQSYPDALFAGAGVTTLAPVVPPQPK